MFRKGYLIVENFMQFIIAFIKIGVLQIFAKCSLTNNQRNHRKYLAV